MPTIPSYNESQVKPVAPTLAPSTAAGATPDAFGAGIGEAVSRLGGAFETNANRWSEEAQREQQQDNEAEANQLTTDYLIKQSAITEEFKQLQGKDPKAVMEQYTTNLKTLRDETRAGAGNPEVARMFDRESQRQFGYAVMNGSSYASTQMRQYQREQASAVKDNMVRANADAANLQTFRLGQASLEEKIRNDPDNHGKSPEAVDALVRAEQGKAWGVWLKDQAEKDPTLARKILKENRSSIDGIVAQNLENVINTQTVAKMSSRLVDDNVTGGVTDTREQKLAYGMSVLTSKYGKAAAAAILGNMDGAESIGLDTKARNVGDGSDGSDSIGIGQWNAERAQALQDFAKKRGTDWHDFKTQVAFIDFELSGSHKSVGDKLKATDDPVAAARIAAGEYEVAGGTVRGNPDGIPSLG